MTEIDTIRTTEQEASSLSPVTTPEHEAAYRQWRGEYHARMGELSRQGMARKAEKGILPCCAQVGYRNYRKKIEIDPLLAPLVRESFERAATSGLPLMALLTEMTAKGLVSRSGKSLKIDSFWYMLRNPFYAGVVRWTGKLIQGCHEPLVDQELLDTVRLRLGDEDM